MQLKHRTTPLRGTTGHGSTGPRHPLRSAVAPLALGSTWTVLRQSRLPKIGGGRTYGRCRPRQICFASRTGSLSVPVRRHPGEVSPLSRGVMSPRGSTPVRPIAGRPSLPPPSFTRRPVGSPCGGPTRAGGRRAYHVASQESSWVRPRLTPVARHLRRMSLQHPDLATYLLVRASQHLWLVFVYDAYGGSPGLAVPRAPGPRPPRCWQSRPRLALRSPPSRVRIRCPEGFAPRRCRRRTPR